MGEASSLHQRRPHGAIIAFMGLPGAGKSTTAKVLASLIPNSSLFMEPHDGAWPVAVNRRHDFGYFTALTWFRSMRVPLLYMAHEVRANSGIAIVDSYYDKLIADYIDHRDMRWLIPPEDQYFDTAKKMAELDRRLLPNADCIVFLRLTYQVWRRLLSTRHREMDAEEQFLQSFPSQQRFLEAAQQFVAQSGGRIIVHDQAFGTPEATARTLLANLTAAGVLSKPA